VQFGILGPLAVWDDGRELTLGGAKPRAVLSILLLHANELVPTSRIVDELWGERPPATAGKTAQVYVSQLRKLLGERTIETRPPGYLLRLEPDALDAHRFDALLDSGKRLLAAGSAEEASVVLQEALALWRGPALADFQYEAFARDPIARLEGLRLVALEQRLEADLALGRHAEAVPELEALVREHPLRESLRRLLMLALYRAGRQADALGAYQDARRTLVDELGLEPSEVLQQLEKAILVHDPSLDLAAPPPAPAPARPVAPAAPSPAPAARLRPAAPPIVCGSCGATNANGAQFCQSCAAPLTVAAPTPEARKTVTVLFCDVVAFTELAGRLDPETLRQVMSRYFELASDVLGRHGGTVEKFIGDEVMAVFGVPVVREDDALRAVRAAVELRESIAALESELASDARLQVRIGVNTGEVVAGDSAAGHGFVTGDPVAVGKRLEETAAPGEILLGGETHGLVAHAVEATPLEPKKLKGKHETLQAFRLAAVDAEATAIPRRDDAPLIGRERELDRLRSLYARIAGGAGARLVTLVGEPGIGKSRLARELIAGVEGEATVLVGRCPPYGEGITFRPLWELLRQAGHEQELTGSSHEIFAAARRILEQLAEERPLVAAFDDVHWAEPTFLDFVEYLAGRLGDAPVLLLCMARPQLMESRPNWLQEPASAVILEPLTEADSERLLEALGAPAAARSRIAEVAEGNPLFVEQLAAITDEHGTGDAMPGSIRGVLHERLDRLDPAERSLLEHASVVGRSFSFEAILELTPADERENVQTRLLALTRKRFVRPDTTSPEEGFRFHHALIRDAAYDGIPKKTRADLHERIASRLEAQEGENALVGYHLEQAFRYRRELGRRDAELGTRAGRLLRAAAKDAFARADLPATVSYFERARALLPADDAAQLLPELGEALFEAGRLTEADELLTEAIENADADPILVARARVEQQFVRLHAESLGDMREARRVSSAALRAFEERGDELGQCRASCLQASIEWIEGHATKADEAWQRAARHADAAGVERELFDILGWRTSAAVEGPTPVGEAIERCTEIRERVRSSPVAVSVMLHPLAALHAMLGEFDEARSLIQEANAILADLGRMQSAVSHHEALVETLAGDSAAAERRLRLGYERLEEMGEKGLLATTAAMLAQAIYGQERYDESGELCSVSEQMSPAEDLLTQVIWRGVRAKLLARQGRHDEADALAREAVRLVDRTDLLTHHGDALLDLAEVQRLAGRTADADAAVQDAIRLYTRKGNVVSAEHARSLDATLASK
jgi:class 3 adenylate cyclase/DNA-binding SARP family transcriptional activator